MGAQSWLEVEAGGLNNDLEGLGPGLGGRGEPRLPPRVCNAMEVLLPPLLPAQDV